MNTITIELCAEDRARLDKLIGVLEARILPRPLEFRMDKEGITVKPAEKETPADAPETPQEAPKAEPEKSIEPEEKEAPAPQAVEDPSITLEQIQQKVVQLAAAGGTKKAKVRTIISQHGTKVSDLKEQPEKWAEVWEQLLALEKEA